MGLGETIIQKVKREARQKLRFPELAEATVDVVRKVDRMREAAGEELTSYGQRIKELNFDLGIGEDIAKSAFSSFRTVSSPGSASMDDWKTVMKDFDRPRGALFGAATEEGPLASIQGAYKGFREPSTYKGRDLPVMSRVSDRDIKFGMSPRDVLGGVADVALDPTNLIGGAGVAPDALKLADRGLLKLPGAVGNSAAGRELGRLGLNKAQRRMAGGAANSDELRAARGIVDDPVAKITQAIKASKPAKRATEAMRTQERRRRVAMGASALDRGGSDAFGRARALQGGELPKASFELPTEITTMDKRALEDMIIKSPLQFYEKLGAQEGLQRLLMGDIPQTNQLEKMERVFGEDMVKAILTKRSGATKLREGIVDIVNIPRALISSIDASGLLRQAIMAAPSHPKEWGKNVPTYVRAIGSEDYANAVDEAIRATRYFPEKEQLGLYHSTRGVAHDLGAREESFMSKMAAKVPGVKQSGRGYTTFLNKLRSDIFDTVANNWEGTDNFTDENLKALVHHINVITGRGDLGRLGAIAPELNALFFSPRLLASRIQAPIEVFTTTPAMRMIAARDLAAFVGMGVTVLGIMKASGADIEMNPISSDFGKGRFGPTRVDFWGGFQQIARYTAQFTQGEGVASQTGEEYDIDRWDVVKNFLRSKLSPGPGSAVDLITGKDMIGEDVSLKSEAFDSVVPIFLNDLKQAYEEYGLRGVVTALPSGVGVNVSSYGGEAEPARKAGFFKIERDAWKAVQQYGPDSGIEGLDKYKSYADWREAAKKQLERQYDESGKDPVYRDLEVSNAIGRTPVAKAMTKAKKALERQFILANPDAAKAIVGSGDYRPGKEERDAIEKLVTAR